MLETILLSLSFEHCRKPCKNFVDFLLEFISGITIEPVILLMALAFSVMNGAQVQTNLLMWKICHVEMKYDEVICGNLRLSNFHIVRVFYYLQFEKICIYKFYKSIQVLTIFFYHLTLKRIINPSQHDKPKG